MINRLERTATGPARPAKTDAQNSPALRERDSIQRALSAKGELAKQLESFLEEVVREEIKAIWDGIGFKYFLKAEGGGASQVPVIDKRDLDSFFLEERSPVNSAATALARTTDLVHYQYTQIIGVDENGRDVGGQDWKYQGSIDRRLAIFVTLEDGLRIVVHGIRVGSNMVIADKLRKKLADNDQKWANILRGQADVIRSRGMGGI